MKKEMEQDEIGKFLANIFIKKWIKDNPEKVELAKKITKNLLLYGRAKIKKNSTS